MTKTSTFAIIITLLFAIIITSCKKEKVKGCTISSATNYDSSAEENDGSCQFEGKQVFWYGLATSDSLWNIVGATSLTYRVDGSVIAVISASVYFNTPPTCGTPGTASITKNLGSSQTGSASYTVVDNFGTTIWSGTLNFNGNTCNATELIY